MVGLNLIKLNKRESLLKLSESMHYSGDNLVTTYYSKLQEGYNKLYAERIVNTIVNESCISNGDFKILEETFNMICENEDNPQYIAYVGRAIVEAVPKVRTGAQLLTNIKLRTRKFKTKLHTNFYKNINKMKAIGANTVNAAKTNFKNNTGMGDNKVNKKDQEKLEEVVTAYENIESAYRESMIIDSMISNYNKISKKCNPIEVVRGTNIQEATVEMANLLDGVIKNAKDKTKWNATIETTLIAFTKYGKTVDPVEVTEAALNYYFMESNNMMYDIADALSTVRILESKDKDKCFGSIFGDITQLDFTKIKYPTLIQESPKATNTKELIKQFKEDENANASKFSKLIRDILSQDPEEIINGMPDTLKLVRNVIDWTIFLFVPFGLIIGPLSMLLNSVTDLVVAVPRYKKLYKYIKDEIKEVNTEIDKCKDKDKIKKLIEYKSSLEKAESKIGFKLWGNNYGMMADSALFDMSDNYIIQEAPQAKSVKELIKQFKEDENATSNDLVRLIRTIVSGDPEWVLEGCPDIFTILTGAICAQSIMTMTPAGVIAGLVNMVIACVLSINISIPRYKNLLNVIKKEIKEVDAEIAKCKDKDKLKELREYKLSLVKAENKIGAKIYGSVGTYNKIKNTETVKEDSSSFVYGYEDQAICQLKAMVEDSKKSSSGKSFSDILSSFKKETNKTPERFKSLLISFYVQKPEDIVNEVPDVLGAVRMFFVVGGSFAINPILGIVSLIADYAIKMHLTRDQYNKYISALEKELKKTNTKIEKATNDTTKDRLTQYKKELEKNINKLKEKEDDLYTDAENDKRKPSDNSSDFSDDEIDFEFGDDFSFEESVNLVVTLEKAVSKNNKINFGLLDDNGVIRKDVWRWISLIFSGGTIDPKHPTMHEFTVGNIYHTNFNYGELTKYAKSKGYETVYSDDLVLSAAMEYYVKSMVEQMPGTEYGYVIFKDNSEFGKGDGDIFTFIVIYMTKTKEYVAIFAPLKKKNTLNGELYWIYAGDKNPKLLDPITIKTTEKKSKLKESINADFINPNAYSLTNLILNRYQDSDTGVLRELLYISKMCPEFIDWDALREELEPYYQEKYIPIRYISDIHESNRRVIIKEFIDESNIDRSYNYNLYEVTNRYNTICPIIHELCYSNNTYSGNTLLQEMDILNTFKMAKENLKRSIKGLSDKEKSLSRNIDVSLNQVSRAVEKALTNDNREAVIRGSLLPSASKVIKMGIVTGAAWMINPVIAVIGAIGAIGASKHLQAKERQLILDDIEIEIEMCERYMRIAEEKNDLKAQKQLLITKRNLERQRQRIKYKMVVYHNQNVGNLKTNSSNSDDDV